MAFVPVPKDLSKVKTKIAFNLTKRQLVCFSIAGLIGIPTYFLTRVPLGTSAAVLVMISLMLPLFFVAMYEKDGQPAEVVLRNIIRAKLWPITRYYQTENLYEYLQSNESDETTYVEKEGLNFETNQTAKTKKAGKSPKEKHGGCKKKQG